jgi:ribosomal protein S18 acetylase RimI-like enzyme
VSRAPSIRYRTRPRDSDVAALRRLVAATGVFLREVGAVAVEVLAARPAHGRKSGYEFLFAERAGELVGYCAWGKVPLTRDSYDLYWIAVSPASQGQGVGQTLMARTEEAVRRLGGGHLYIETSSRGVYARTRRFYRDAGYRLAARLPDFYAPGDHKVVFCKVLRARRASGPRRPRAAERGADSTL